MERKANWLTKHSKQFDWQMMSKAAMMVDFAYEFWIGFDEELQSFLEEVETEVFDAWNQC